MSRPLPSLTEALLSAAKKAGADAADAMALEGRSLDIAVRKGGLEQAERAEGTDIGLRVFVGQRQACVSASDTSDATITMLADRAVAMAREAPVDPHAGLADPAQLATDWDVQQLELADPSPEPSPNELQTQALEAEAAAQAVKGISQVQSASGSYLAQRIQIAASNGFVGGYERTRRSLSCGAIAGDGAAMQRDHDGDSRIFADDLRAPRDIGQSAGERAAQMLGARKPPTGAYPVVFDERIAGSLVGHLLVASNGVSVARGSSWLLNKLGERVLPKGVSLIEDPLRPRVSGSRPFDAEGLPTAARHIVEDGVLKGWTLDLATGRKLGFDSTANARRSAAAPPSPGVGNVALSQGDKSKDDLLAQMGTGLLVTSMIGSTINPNTGDYSRGASGFWIENGEISYPVNECTIAGNLLEMLLTLQPANDARMWLSRTVPSLLVEGMTLAGD